MNKVYKVIWSKVRNCYMVVSELAKRNGKCSSSLNKKIIAAFLAAGMALTYSVVAEAVASVSTTDNRNVGLLVNADGAREITSPYIQVQGVEEATAAREFIQNNPDRNLYAGTNRTKQAEWDRQYNLANSYASATGNYAIAVGRYATTGRNATLDEAQIGAYNALQQTIKNDAAFAGVTAVQNATNYAALVSALNSVGSAAANSYVTQLNNRVTSLQNQAPTSTNAIAVGNNATAGGTSAIAVGNAATALKEDGTAANNAIALGNGSKARNTNAIAVGAGETISRDVKRPGTTTTIKTSTPAGAYGKYDIAIGKAAAHGDRASATTGAGTNADTDIGGYYTINTSTALPSENKDNPNGGAIAVGYEAQAVRQNTIAVGTQALAGGQDAIAVGRNARALTPGSIAIGSGEAGKQGVQGNGGINTPKDTPDKGGYSITIGRGAVNFTYGYSNSDDYYANTRNSIAIGNFAHTHAANAFAIGVSTDATAERSFAIGTTTTNNAEPGTSYKYEHHRGARAGGQGSLTFGDQAVVGVKKPIDNTDEEERGGHVLVNDAMAMGTNSWAQARNGVALGGGMSYTYHDTSADGKTMTNITQYYDGSGWVDRAEGTGAHVGLNADGGVAIGGATGAVDLNGSESHWPTTAPGAVTGYTKAAQATVARSVALGTGSVANREAMKPIIGTAPAYATSGYDVSTGKAYAGKGEDSAVWKSTLGAFSIGEETGLSKDVNGNIKSTVVNTRQITGVAAGSADTDAVNVAQLKLSMIEIKAGNNITVTTDVAPEGHLIYTISGMKGGAVDSDDRVVTLTPTPPDNKDEKSITSPYLHFNGLDKAATADYAQAKATDSIAMGRSATAGESARRGIAIGKNAAVHGEDTVALGPNAQASNRYAVALGADTKASIPTSVALGSQSVTTEKDTAGFYSGRVGYDVATDTTYRGADRYASTWQSTDGSVSVGGGIDPYTGTPAMTRRISNVAAGVYDTDVVNVAQLKRVTLYKTDYRSTAIGTDAEGNTEITSPYINVHGVKEAAEAKTLLNVYKTYESYETTLAKNIQTLTIEKKDLTRDVNTLASRISDVDAKMKALSDPKSEAYKTLADEKAYLVGEHTTLSSELKEITEELTDTEARLGTAAEDYKKAQELVDSQARAEGKDSVAVGAKSVASGDQTIAMGTDNAISGNLSTAVGAGNTVTGEQSIAVGTGHEVHGNNSGVFGDPTIINADNSYSVGNNNTIGGQSKEKDVKLNNVFIIGNESSVDTSDTFVLGSNVTKTAENSVFLGNKAAYVEEGKTTAGMSDYSSETINGKTYHFAGGKPAGVVSVGNENETRRIQNVAAGKISADSTDAINGSQLYSAIENVNTNLGDQISNVDSRATKGIAGAAALAALHPLDFDPDDKLTFAAGMGHYRGKTAAALGLFYRADEKVMFSLGGTVGNSENMVNAGISFSLDRTPRVTGSRTALTKEVVHLREHVARQDAQLALQDQQLAMQGAQIAQLTALVSQLTGKKVELPTIPQVKAPALFPDNLDNKWAYEKLEELEQQGYIRGYAGRTLSRDEFAAALDRALAGGATLEERLVKEFEPELSHVRVAHVEGKGNNEGEWYERPRASHDKLEKHEIAKKLVRVQKKEK